MDLERADQKLKQKLADMKEQKRHDEIIGLIALLGENLTDDIRKAVEDIKIEVPEIKIPEIVIPKIEVPTIPEIKIPEIKIPEMPKMDCEPIYDAIVSGFAGLEFPAPVVNVEAPQVNVKAPEVVVNVPEIKIPKTKRESNLPEYDSGTVHYTLEPVCEIWTLKKGDKVVAEVTLTYRDTDMTELLGFNIKKYV